MNLKTPCLVRLKQSIKLFPNNSRRMVDAYVGTILLVLGLHDATSDESWNYFADGDVHWVLYDGQKCTTCELIESSFEAL